MPMRSFRLPDDLDARLEESRGEQKRSEWLLEAVREKLARSEGIVVFERRVEQAKCDPAIEAAFPGLSTVTRVSHAKPIDRADAFRAAAARRQAALRQKP